MKSEFEQRTNPAATATIQARRRSIWPSAVAGFGLGVTAATLYLLLGGQYFWNIPLAARIGFYPGFAVGEQVYAWSDHVGLTKVAGVLAVGLTYAVVAVFARLVCATLRGKK